MRFHRPQVQIASTAGYWLISDTGFAAVRGSHRVAGPGTAYRQERQWQIWVASIPAEPVSDPYRYDRWLEAQGLAGQRFATRRKATEALLAHLAAEPLDEAGA